MKQKHCTAECAPGALVCIGSSADNKAAYEFGQEMRTSSSFFIGLDDQSSEGSYRRWCNNGCGEFESWENGE